MADVIPLHRLAFALVPVFMVLVLMFRWSLGAGSALVGLARMILQLLLVGYLLGYVFTTETPWIVLAIMMVMLLAASWIALRSIKQDRARNFPFAVLSVAVGGGITLLMMTQAVLGLDPWYLPRVFIPLAGMTFSGCMNAVSLAAERYYTEVGRGQLHHEARVHAMKAAFIPITNMLFAVGIVSIPGMMTGQVLAGVSPLIAARYQVMVMCMMFSSAGLAAAMFLWLIGRAESSQMQTHPIVTKEGP
ncbi:ABC transporter permease [Novipirellula artificiosorum]|uniref:ABC transporter permease n=1 Tax=Novipirellula artificiosorum TaxID=2528016 RepID=A0A5C6DZ78_9BACT|nr:ABC transporter permease [Novipirellula artificiosorum]TWU40741.1 hypothetical protein Poly41_15760 [Novipirellula artificiosorum]